MAVDDPSSRLTVEIHRLFFLFKYTILPNIFLALILASRLPRWTHYVFLACYICLSTFAFMSSDKLRTGYAWSDFMMGSTLGSCLFNALHMLVLVDPWKVYRHRKDDPRMEPGGLSWARRVYWAWCATVSQRGIGWNYQMPHIPSAQHKSKGRTRFSLYALRQVLFYVFLLDLAQMILQDPPSLHNLDSELYSIRSIPYPQRVFYTATWFIGAYAGINASYFACVLVFVGVLGFSEEQDWPPFFGNLTDAYSVRNFWGRTWHQLVRRFCVSPGRKLNQMLGIAPKSVPAALIQLYLAFFISGIMHSLGDLMLGREYVGASLVFFGIQPLAITFEEIVKFFLRQYVPDPIRVRTGSIVGYFWVVFWFTVTGPFLIDPAIRAGFNRDRIFPYSPVQLVAQILYPY
ncbi:hypothetical protein BT96DRAFT_861658 [Gymnopus androsaceus JB14]|uniref:Wax synthase domain-containing protein n=1 Tax=Gymnopus androsaceus JB14 TaxID=1447944 RepID=A0A6A4HDM2_9AGAR|nr:hypothetical protein BT96DRAFT_861658 [Gymnopus androsaceus JB14]